MRAVAAPNAEYVARCALYDEPLRAALCVASRAVWWTGVEQLSARRLPVERLERRTREPAEQRAARGVLGRSRGPS
jgi:hypothetical protein